MHFERRRELKKLNHSLLANFLDLLDLLVHCPDSPKRAEKVEDLSLLFIHIHHLLNEFRPHQARETLRVMMELQKRQRVETATRYTNTLFPSYLTVLLWPQNIHMKTAIVCLPIAPFACFRETYASFTIIYQLLWHSFKLTLFYLQIQKASR